MTSDKQNKLTAAMDAKGIDAKWNCNFLSCKVGIKSGRKTKWQRFSIVFDDPAELDGPRVTRKMSGAYSEHYARQAFAEAIRVGQGQEAADKFAAECAATA